MPAVNIGAPHVREDRYARAVSSVAEDYAVRWSERLRAYVQDTSRLLGLSYEGMSRIRGMPDLHRILTSVTTDQSNPELDAERGKHFATNAELAAAQIDSDFAMLHAHTVVGLWGMLEASIEDLAARWIGLRPDVMQAPVFAKIRVPVALYEGLSAEARRELIVRELQRELRSDLSRGVGQFEGLLNAVGLGGGVDERVRTLLHEMQQSRHVIAHRGGVVDERFVAACPQAGYAAGEELRIGSTTMANYLMALALYMRTVENRALRALGADPPTDGVPTGFEGALDVR